MRQLMVPKTSNVYVVFFTLLAGYGVTTYL